MSMRKALLVVLLVIGPHAQKAAACSCGGIIPPCAAAWRADAVFIGTAVEQVAERLGGNLNWHVTRVSVHQRLRGDVSGSITLVPPFAPSPEQIANSTQRPGPVFSVSSCDYRFEPGRRYVIYAKRTADGRWSTGSCTGTKPIEEAAADLDYFAGLGNAAPTGRVYGSIDRMIRDRNDGTKIRTVPAAGVPVTLTSGVKEISITTDAEGKLDVAVPPGEYVIAPVVPPTIRVYGDRRPRSIPARGCAPVRFSLIADGRVSGRVVDPDGRGVPRTSVDLVPVDSPDGRPPEYGEVSPSGMTDADGRFEVGAILPGRYFLAVNARSGARVDSPYAATYFPRGDRDGATVIEIDEGERKSGFTITVRPLPDTTLSGRVVSDDEQPVPNAEVTIWSTYSPGMVIASAKTDRTGAFQVRVPGGRPYRLRATTRTAAGVRHGETVVTVTPQMPGVRVTIRKD
jgi:protocatechuate 3,4-dioxygenase beta subunit